MEEQKVIRELNWYYYGVMVFTLIILAFMYYVASRPDFEPVDTMSDLGIIVQYAAIFITLVAIPFGLYQIKYRKPKTYEDYKNAAAFRIFLCGSPMSMNIAVYYLLGCYRPMIWVAAISAIAWYFSKPTLGKMDQEMTPEDPNEETY